MPAILPSFSWFFLFAFALNGFIAIGILIFKNPEKGISNRFLAINLIGLCLSGITISLIGSRLILEVPHFYRLPSPIIYMMFPAAFLYVKLKLNNQLGLDKWDYLHFLPALIHLVEMTPFYLSSAEVKIKDIDLAFNQNIQVFAHGEGWMPPYIHNLIRGGLALIYAFAMWRLIHRYSRAVSPLKINFGRQIRWLKLFSLINGVLGISLLAFLALQFIPADIRSLGLHIIILFALVLVNVYLFFEPAILYGSDKRGSMHESVEGELTNQSKIELRASAEGIMSSGALDSEISARVYANQEQVHQNLIQSLIKKEPEEDQPQLSVEKIAEIKVKLSELDADKKFYQAKGYAIRDLAKDTGIPSYLLTIYINRVLETNFSDFINEKRIEECAKLMEAGSFTHFTLEGLAETCGFSNRNSFLSAFKRFKGMTPSAFKKTLKESDTTA